jgi:hypothetical protein
MVRKQVYIDERQEALLKEFARQLGTTEAELIRRALDRAFLEPGGLVSEAAFQAFLDYAAQRERIDVKPQPRTWRRDDLYEL